MVLVLPVADADVLVAPIDGKGVKSAEERLTRRRRGGKRGE